MAYCWETPRGRYDAVQKKFSLDYETKVIESSRTWRRLSKVSRSPITIIGVDLHTITNKLLCPNETERLPISLACRTQRINYADVNYDESEI